MGRTTRNNPSPGGLRPPLETPKRPRAPRGKKLPAKAVVDPAPAPVVASPAPSTTAPSPSDDETEAPTPTRPSSPLQRITARVTRAMSRESSRSVSPPITAMVDSAKKAIKDAGKAIAKSTAKSDRSTQQQPDAKLNKRQKKNKNVQPLGAISREKRSHSQLSLASQTSDDEEPRPSKKSKNTAELEDIDPTRTVFNTRVPKVNNNNFPPRDQHVAAPTEPVDENEEDISHFSRLDDGNQSTPRSLEQTTSIPTAEAEAASPSLFGPHASSQATSSRRVPRLTNLKTIPKVTDGGFRRRNYAPPEDEESFDIDDITVPRDPFAFNRRVREVLLPKKEVLGTPRVEKPKQKISRKHPAAFATFALLVSINRPDVTESARTMIRWAQENEGIRMPGPEKLRAMLEAHKAQLSTAEAPNHTREDVSEDTSSRPRDEPSTSMAHESPQETGVATTSHHSSPSESLASPTTPTTPTANIHIVPNETLETNNPPETPTPPPTIGRARAAFQGFSSMVGVVASPLKRIFGTNQPRAGPLNPIPCGRRIPPVSRKPQNSDLEEREEQMKRQREQQRAQQLATVEAAEDGSNPSNRTLAEDGQAVGQKRRYSGTYCFPESPYSDDTSMMPTIQSSNTMCYVHPGQHHQRHSTPFERIQPTNPFPTAPNPYKPSAEVEAALGNYFNLINMLESYTSRSRHWRCAMAYRNDWWSQIRVVQSGMTDCERYWDDRLRLLDYFRWLQKHGLYANDNTLDIVWLNGIERDDKYYETMWKAEKAELEEATKPKTFSVPDNLPSDYEEEHGPENHASVHPAVQPAITPVEPVKSANVLQEIDRNQRPPPTPKPANAALPKTPYDIPNKPAKPSNLREVMAMSPPMEQGSHGKEQGTIEKENAFVPSNKPFKWTLGGEPEIRVMEDTKEPIPMDEWKEAAEALLRAEGMEPLPNAFW